ncbi:hypothetical protein FNV43_RR01078 [Rhamnella rubrinervis]|uniref:Uncharacterized protein n=1 Tax=Rhamnella rubrinervis TaxID=2594499 RepID=A0A8K0MSL9_9ROSA|nr:hypothetical protein FNV43_RR01078 [Rhamnella rubrinervis]
MQWWNWYRLPEVAVAKSATPCAVAGFNRRCLPTAEASIAPPPSTSLRLPNSNRKSPTLSSSSYSDAVSAAVAPPTQLVTSVGLSPTPELGLLSLLFVLSTAFRRLKVSVYQLSNVVSQEVPGTLFSLKLSGLEIQELTQQLASLGQKISASRYAKKSRSSTKKPTSFGRRSSPNVDPPA